MVVEPVAQPLKEQSITISQHSTKHDEQQQCTFLSKFTHAVTTKYSAVLMTLDHCLTCSMWQKQAVSSHTEMRLNVTHEATITVMTSLFLVDASMSDASMSLTQRRTKNRGTTVHLSLCKQHYYFCARPLGTDTQCSHSNPLKLVTTKAENPDFFS